MCFNSSNSKRADALARKYGRKTNVVEIWKEIMEEKRRNGEIMDLTDGAYNIPAYSSPYISIVIESEELQPMRWGLISSRTKDWKTVVEKDKKNWYKNARAEELSETWPYRYSFDSKRCIMPVTGFFDWHETESGIKVPYYIHLQEEEVFAIGALWDEWTNPETGEKIKSCVMVTIQANELMCQVHNAGNNPFRMPFVMPEEDIEKWLDSSLPILEVNKLLKIFPSKYMDAYPVENNFRDKKNIFNPEIIKRRA